MKKIIIAILGALLLAGCGVGNYSISSGKADQGMLSFVSADKTPITVTVDNDSYDIYTVKTKAWHKDRDIKTTTENTIFLTPGQHSVVVSMNGKEVCNRKVFISVQEHKIIEL